MPTLCKTYQTYMLRTAAVAAVILGFVYAINYTVDPFGYNKVTVLAVDRELVSRPIARNVLAAAQFHAADASVVLFGNSVMRALPAAGYTEGTNTKAFNFSIGGASLRDVLDVIDYVVEERPSVHTFIIGVSFRALDDSKIGSNFRQNLGVIENGFTLNTSLTALHASIANLLYAASGQILVSDAPALEEDAHWQYLMRRETAAVGSRIGATQLKASLHRTVCRLRSRGANVILVIPPVHQELRHMLLAQTGDEYHAFKAWLKGIATVYDFDIESPLTAERAIYLDPLHLKPEAARRVAYWLREPDPSVVEVTHANADCSDAILARSGDR